MASTFLNPDWLSITHFHRPKSVNPVLGLVWQTEGLTLWLKAAPGGQRIEFAGEVMTRAGFAGSGTRVLKDPELTMVLATLCANADAEVAARAKKMVERVNAGEDLVLLEHVQGTGTYSKVLDGNADEAETGVFHSKVVARATIQRDIARLIAADLILGNFDRLSHNKGYSKFHAGNFIYDAASEHFLPIDNDTVAPSIEYIKDQGAGKTKRKPTPEDLYRVAIEGGLLLNPGKVFPSAEQGSMDDLLGEKAVDAIAHMLGSFFGTAVEQAVAPAMRTAAEKIAPMVKEEVAKLLKEIKNPEGQRTSLFGMMKSYNSVAGMNYSTFKVKCRFADYVVHNKGSVDEGKAMAINYGLYREWKTVHHEALYRPLADYKVPDEKVEELDALDKGARAAMTGINTVRSLWSDTASAEVDAKKAAKAAKLAFRDPDSRALLSVMRGHYDKLKDLPDTDNRVKKAKVLVISVLIAAELDSLRKMLDEVKDDSKNPAAMFYRHAIIKRTARFQQALDAYDRQIQKLAKHLPTLKQKDRDLIVLNDLTTALADCRTKFGEAAAWTMSMAKTWGAKPPPMRKRAEGIHHRRGPTAPQFGSDSATPTL